MKKALITGGAGFIGSHIADLLLENNIEVKILDNLLKPVHKEGKPDYLPKDIEFIEGDVRNRSDLKSALEGVDVVFHEAAYQGFLPDFSTFFHVNSVGTALIMELIVEKKLPIEKIVIASSQAVYGEGKYRCKKCDKIVYPQPRPVEQLMQQDWEVKCPNCEEDMVSLLTDEDHIEPHTQYAMSKYTQEMIGINLGRRYEVPVVGLRYSITQGPRQSFYNAYSGILRIFCLRLMKKKKPVIYEDGNMKRDYVHVKDVAKANLLVMQKDEANYQVYNVGSGIPTTQLEFYNALSKKLGKQHVKPEIPGEFRFGDVRHIVSDISKLKALGWQPTHNLEKIMDDYIAWVETQDNLEDYFAEPESVMKEKGAIRKVKGD